MANEIKYTMTAPTQNATGVAIVSYAVDTTAGCTLTGIVGVLRSVEFNETCDIKSAVMQMVPLMIEYDMKTGKVPEGFGAWMKCGGKVKDVTEFDVSFGRFWQQYGYKVGNKGGAEKAWSKLGFAERILAIGAIPRLQRHCEQHKTDLPYPTTYLNQRRWENEFEG